VAGPKPSLRKYGGKKLKRGVKEAAKIGLKKKSPAKSKKQRKIENPENLVTRGERKKNHRSKKERRREG